MLFALLLHHLLSLNMFSTHCVTCNVSVQPNEAEWLKHNNGKVHRKKSVNSLLSANVSQAKVVSSRKVSEKGGVTPVLSTHSSLKDEGHLVHEYLHFVVKKQSVLNFHP